MGKSEKKIFKGVVTMPFKVKKKSYHVGDEYSTTDKNSFDYLKKSFRVKDA